MFDATLRDGALRLRREGTRWLSTGYAGGESRGPAAYNVTVPDGWPETEDEGGDAEAIGGEGAVSSSDLDGDGPSRPLDLDGDGPSRPLDLDAYIRRRLARAGFGEPGPTLLTGVEQRHARRARLGSVEAVVTAGVSNPATLPMSPGCGGPAAGAPGGRRRDDARSSTGDEGDDGGGDDVDRCPPTGTVNVVLGTTRALAPGALANLLTVVAEAKAATLLARTGFTGTTSDAVVVGCDPDGEPAAFSGSATDVGTAARACVRDALSASLDSRYADVPLPASVADATYGVVTDERAAVSKL
ncbi:adenosylcobinamide amidohydrolase [Halegenticoccus tardaugens]|uniref:adenosylcobinamide amidohydrolase n=1 Tax=Halegenticoccus tardaugens TaxID=2071624 RepID=UPI001E3A47D0|nr:adenosylcobinamide amidohydrolase [Halegenticoccus tardaugens]